MISLNVCSPIGYLLVSISLCIDYSAKIAKVEDTSKQKLKFFVFADMFELSFARDKKKDIKVITYFQVNIDK